MPRRLVRDLLLPATTLADLDPVWAYACKRDAPRPNPPLSFISQFCTTRVHESFYFNVSIRTIATTRFAGATCQGGCTRADCSGHY
jgi:hypothetical protein